MAALVLAAPSMAFAGGEPLRVLPNDNRRAAGTLADNTLTLNLRAGWGSWRPEGEDGPSLRIQAFGSDGDDLRVPAPLIRVRAATAIAVSIRNELEATLTVHGLCARARRALCAHRRSARRGARRPLHDRSSWHVSLLGDASGCRWRSAGRLTRSCLARSSSIREARSIPIASS